MVKYQGLLVLFALLLEYTLVKVNSKIHMKVTNLECFPNLDWVNMTCKLKALNWRRSLIDIDAELKQDFHRVKIHAQVFRRFTTYQPFPVKVEFQSCPLARGGGKNYFFTPFISDLAEKYSNLNHTCPYRKGEKLIARDLDWQPFDFMTLNLGSPGDGRYRLNISFYGNGAKTRAALIVGYGDLIDENSIG